MVKKGYLVVIGIFLIGLMGLPAHDAEPGFRHAHLHKQLFI